MFCAHEMEVVMWRPSLFLLVILVIGFLLPSSLAWAQPKPGSMDPDELNRRFENLRAIQRFGRSMDSATMRETLFAPVPYEVAAYSKVPKKARSDFERGNSALQRGEFGKAKEQYESAIAEYPDFALAHHNLAVAAMNLKDSQRARDEFRAALKSDPQMISAYQNLGVLEVKE